MCLSNPKSELDPAAENAYEYAQRTVKGITEKAKSNKKVSQRLFVVILVATSISPVLIFLPFCDLISKGLPAFLSVSAAIASGWIQLRKPEERWILYRTAQRELEFQIDQYIHNIGEYEDPDKKDAVLADKVSQRALQLHYEWVPIVPRADKINQLSGKK